MNENRHDKKPTHNIDELFKTAIDPYKEPPSEEVWEGVEKVLDRYNIIQIKRKYNSLKKTAILLVLLLSLAVIYELQKQYSSSNKDNIVVKEQDIATPKINVSEKEFNKKRDMASYEPTISSIGDAQDPNSGKRPVNALSGIVKSSSVANTKDIEGYVLFPSKFSGIEKDVSGLNTGSDAEKGQNDEVLLNNTIENRNDYGELSPANRLSSSMDISGLPKNYLQDHNPIMVKGPDFYFTAPLLLIRGQDLYGKVKLSAGRKRSPFALTLIFSPDFTSRRVVEDWPVNREDNKDEIRKSERYAFSYSLGALVDYKISNRWSVQTGFTLSRAVINIGPKFIFARPDNLGDMKYKFNSSSGYSFLSSKTVSRPVFGDSLHAFGSTSSLQYTSIPLAVKYELGKKKLHFYGLAGAAANVLIKDKIETSLFSGGNHENAVDRNIKGLKPVYFSALLGAGAEYNINKTFTASFTPTARYALTSINKDTPVKSYQQSLGLVAGVQINL